MLLTLTTTHRPATDLGFLLRKNPARAQSFELTFGQAHVFYPEATEERCTIALLVEVDPVGLVRRRQGFSGERSLDQYVNDRPYAASSFLSVAIGQVFGSALAGRSKERPELATAKLPFQVRIPALPCRGGDCFLRKLFEPLGYTITTQAIPLDTQFRDWGDSPYLGVEMECSLPLQTLLSHLYALVPVLDNSKHYWVGDDEVAKLLRRGSGWLASHPEREAITNRYLKHRRILVNDALARLVEESDEKSEERDAEEAFLEATVAKTTDDPRQEPKTPLNEQRLGSVLAVLKASGASRVIDLGCGEGRLIQGLMKEKQFTEIVGMDVSHRCLEIAHDRLRVDRLPPAQKGRLKLIQGSLIYRDKRIEDFDAAAVVEVIEHLDPPRLAAFERVLFERARPETIVITTPNREYNVKWESLPAEKFRHRDHRFEWTRAEFQAWAGRIAGQYGYTTRFLPVGPEDPKVGAPTQMIVFCINS